MPLTINDRTMTSDRSPHAARLLRDVWCECGGVTGDERVRVMKSPAQRSRAGLGVHGVAGVLILS
jgi:hypothetical protein